MVCIETLFYHTQVQLALARIGPTPTQNELLEELIKVSASLSTSPVFHAGGSQHPAGDLDEEDENDLLDNSNDFDDAAVQQPAYEYAGCGGRAAAGAAEVETDLRRKSLALGAIAHHQGSLFKESSLRHIVIDGSNVAMRSVLIRFSSLFKINFGVLVSV